MPSKVVTTLQQYRTRMNGREDALMKEMGREWMKMESELQGNINKLAEEMTRRKLMGETISQGLIYKSERYKILQAQMQEQIKSYNQDFAVTAISNAQEDAYKLGIDSAQQALLDSFASPLSANFNRIDISAVENLIGLAGDGAPLGKLLGDDYGPAARGIIDGLLSGVANGVGASQTAKRMVDGMSIGLDRALLIARTETNRAYRMASTEQYRSSGVTSGYKRLAAKAEACLACLLLDGKEIPAGEELSDHPNGRCTVVPIVIGVDPPEWETGKQWLLKQPESTQRRIMGDTRFEMFKDGMDLDNFVGLRHNKIWGDSPYTIPIQNLKTSSDARVLSPEQIAARKARAARRRAIRKGQPIPEPPVITPPIVEPPIIQKPGSTIVGQLTARGPQGDSITTQIEHITEWADQREGLVVVKIKGEGRGEILFSNHPYATHNQMIKQVHPDLDVDSYVRFYYQDGKLKVKTTGAGVSLDVDEWKIKATDNIYKAGDYLERAKIPSGTIIDVDDGDLTLLIKYGDDLPPVIKPRISDVPDVPTLGKKILTPEQKAARKARAAARKAKKAGLVPADDTLKKLEDLTKKIQAKGAKPKVSDAIDYVRRPRLDNLKGRELVEGMQLNVVDEEVKRVSEIIDSIHKDGNLKSARVSIEKIIDKDKNTMGMFTHNQTSLRKIEVKGLGDTKQVGMNYAHEVGHWIDLDGIPYRGGYETFASGYRGLPELTRALNQSPEMIDLAEKYATYRTAKGGKTIKNYLEYVNRDREVFARAYCQYIATKSQDPALLAELRKMQKSTFFRTQWSDENFEPIMKEFDALFEKLGWLE